MSTKIKIEQENNFVLTPKYVRELKIKVKKIRIDKTVPKVFAD